MLFETGVPVATVAINGAANAALLAVEILALKDDGLFAKLVEYRRSAQNKVLEKDAALSGGAVSTSGTGDTETASFSFSDGDLPSYFQLQAKINGTDSIVGGDCHIIIYKCKASAIPINGVQSDFATYTFDGKGVFTEHKFGSSSPVAKLVDINFNAKAKDLSAITSAGV